MQTTKEMSKIHPKSEKINKKWGVMKVETNVLDIVIYNYYKIYIKRTQ
jgi:hypothetical protein